jgi:hypothetical protein
MPYGSCAWLEPFAFMKRSPAPGCDFYYYWITLKLLLLFINNYMEEGPSKEANIRSVCQNWTRTFTAVFTRGCHCTLSWARWIHSTPSVPKNPSSPRSAVTFRLVFWWRMFAFRPILMLEHHPLSSVRGCLFSISSAVHHVWRPSRNLRTLHVVVARDSLSM